MSVASRMTRRQFLAMCLKGSAASVLAALTPVVPVLAALTPATPIQATFQMAMKGGIVQSPPGRISTYPPRGTLDYPPNWDDPIYDPIVSFQVHADDVPVGRDITYRWAAVANPGNWRFRLRRKESNPPGEPLQTEVFYPEAEKVWLPFWSRVELDNGRSRHEFNDYRIECVVKAKEPGIFGNEETLTLNLPIELAVTSLEVYDLFFEEKLERAIQYSIPYWPASVKDQAETFFTDPAALGFLVSTTAIFIGVAMVPSPWAKVLGIAFSTVLIVDFGAHAFETLAKTLSSLAQNCRRARTDTHLRRAGQQFAEDGGELVFNMLLSLVLWRVGRKVTEQVHTEVRTARLRVVETLETDLKKSGLTVVRPPEYLNLVEKASVLVRRMNLREDLKLLTGVGKAIRPGTPPEKVFSIDEPYEFKKEHLKNPGDYRIEHKIPITEEIRAMLKLAVNNNVKIPQELKHFPRFKFENKRFNVVIPKALWTEFQVMFTEIDVTIVPVDGGLQEHDAETFDMVE